MHRAIKIAAVLLAALLLAVSMVAFAQDCRAQECTVSAPIHAGAVAPCSGVVFPQAWAFQAIQCIDVDLPMEKTRAELCENRQSANLATWGNQEKLYRAQIRDLEELTRKAAQIERPWFESKWIWFTVGAVSAGSLIVLIK